DELRPRDRSALNRRGSGAFLAVRRVATFDDEVEAADPLSSPQPAIVRKTGVRQAVDLGDQRHVHQVGGNVRRAAERGPVETVVCVGGEDELNRLLWRGVEAED